MQLERWCLLDLPPLGSRPGLVDTSVPLRVESSIPRAGGFIGDSLGRGRGRGSWLESGD